MILRNDGTEVVYEKKVAPVMSAVTLSLAGMRCSQGYRSGHAAFATSGSYFVVDNTDTGFDLRKVETGSLVRTFETPPAQFARPKQVAFGEEGAVVVGGSDHGAVYVFETATGGTLQTLQHTKGGMVQTVSVSRQCSSMHSN